MAGAQQPATRLAEPIQGGSRTTLVGSQPRRALAGIDEGALAPGKQIHGITIVFSRSASQEADLQSLLAAQQNPASPLYHKWLTPEQFATRFGVADADLAKVQSWLEQQGFAINAIGHSRNQITFSGTAGQVAAAFGAELHYFASGGEVNFAPANDLSLPSALGPMVTAVLHLSTYHPHRALKLRPAGARPAYTSSQTQNHFLTPLDVATMYDMNATYSAGINGAGQAVAILGESYISAGAITAFQTAAGLPSNLPNLVLVPDTGVSAVNPLQDGDEGESELDVEYATGMARGANVFLVYTGDSQNSGGVFESLSYAIDWDIAPVISGSYTDCETDFQVANGAQTANEASAQEQAIEQGNAQGQTVVFAAGDEGSTSCYGFSDLTTVQQQALVVNFPGSIPAVTAIGGTQMAAGTFATGSTTYWTAANGSDVIGSLTGYVPEVVWNEDSASDGIGAGAGGVSVLYTRPSWQAGVAGIPSGTQRLVPDVSLQASTLSPGYLYCTDDPSDLSSESLTASCSSGFRDSAGNLTVAGGTSFGAPIFAGMLAVLNQAKNATGQGNVNPILYQLATDATTYGTVFHDISSGTNACTAGTTYCSTSGASDYAAAAGYDEATGLGTVDFGNLVSSWPATNPSSGGATGSSLAATRTTLTAATLTPASGATDAITITVGAASSTGATPTGVVNVAVDGGQATPLTLNNGQATYTYPGSTNGGSHVIVAAYQGDTAGTYAPSLGTLSLTLAGSSVPSGTFTLAASAVTVAANGLANGTITVTPASGYTGAVSFSLAVPANAPTICYLINPNSAASNVTVGTGATAATIEIGVGTECTSTASGAVILKGSAQKRSANDGGRPAAPWRAPAGTAMAGLLLTGFVWRRRSGKLPVLLGVALLGAVGLGLSGCGGGGGSSTAPVTPVNQTYTLTLTGVDSVNASIAASTTFTLTVD